MITELTFKKERAKRIACELEQRTLKNKDRVKEIVKASRGL